MNNLTIDLEIIVAKDYLEEEYHEKAEWRRSHNG